MKIGTALIFVAVGIWIAYNKPEFADMVIGYINLAVDYLMNLISSLGS